jgi:hypothetical protein
MGDSRETPRTLPGHSPGITFVLEVPQSGKQTLKTNAEIAALIDAANGDGGAWRVAPKGPWRSGRGE